MFRGLIEHIKKNDFHLAKKIVFEALKERVEPLLEDRKKWLQAETILSDEEKQVLDEARFRIVPVRIRRGKIQRRKKVATGKGFTIRKGKVLKMLPKERRNRKLSQRRGKIKRRAKQARTKAKQKRSMRRLKAMGGGGR